MWCVCTCLCKYGTNYSVRVKYGINILDKVYRDPGKKEKSLNFFNEKCTYV